MMGLERSDERMKNELIESTEKPWKFMKFPIFNSKGKSIDKCLSINQKKKSFAIKRKNGCVVKKNPFDEKYLETVI